MPSRIKKLSDKGLIQPPKWLPESVMYETIMGSVAYGVSSDTSDMDVYAFCIPPKGDVFPHTRGHIYGFGLPPNQFKTFQVHHVRDPGDKTTEYDISVYGIVSYFDFCLGNNPNMIDSLFTPRRCVLHTTEIGEYVRTNRKLFLHKGCWNKFKGYAYSQLAKIEIKVNTTNPKRRADIDAHGYDTKFAYHVVRLLGEVEQILLTGDLDLEFNREQLKSIRRGEWSLEEIRDWFTKTELSLEEVYRTTNAIPDKPNTSAVKDILFNCLEMYYGSIDEMVREVPPAERLIVEMQSVLDKYKG